MRLEFLAVLFVALMCICAVSAADDDYFNENMTVTIHGFDFTIPEGFTPYEDANLNETEDGITTICEFFINEDGEVLMLSVIYGDDLNFPNL